MSLLKSNSVQIGQSTTGTNNFTLSVPSSPDGTIKLARGNSGATTADVLTVNASGAITGATINGGTITSGTAVASTSGTAIDFTNIPSWVKRITVMFQGVSTSSTSIVQVQLGSGSFATSGYYSASSDVSSVVSTSTSTTGIIFTKNNGAADVRLGTMTITNVSGNIWIATATSTITNSAVTGLSSGNITLSGGLDRVRITTVNGTDTFDAGSVNILYEG